MSIQIQGSASLVRKFFVAMSKGFMQRNGVSQTKIDQITQQLEIINTPPAVMSMRYQSQPTIHYNRFGTPVLVENDYRN